MASTYELIETTTLSSSASSVTFTSITQDYRDLVLVLEASGTEAFGQFVNAQFNNDTGSNYNFVDMKDGPASTATSNATSLRLISDGVSSSSTVLIILQIMDYSATDKHKSTLSRGGKHPAQQVDAFAGRWADTSALTEIDLAPASGSFASGATFSLYGIAS